MRGFVVRMPGGLHAAVKARAAAEGLSMAEAIRRALLAYVEMDRKP